MQRSPHELSDFRSAGPRWGQLLALLGLTGMAISQPLLGIAGENPSLFTFAGVRGGDLVIFALVVAVVPPLVLWAVVAAVGLVHRRAGDIVFVVVAAGLAALAVVQWVKAAGIERRWLVAVGALVLTGLFVVALTRLPLAATFTRYTAVLPVVVLLLFVVSPSGDLLGGERKASSRSASDVAPVVFVMLDEFPTLSYLGDDRNVDAVRFPNLAAFGDDATWYRNYTTMAGGTIQAVPSVLTGTKPTDLNSALWTGHPNNLFDMLEPTHDLEVSETATQLCGYSTCGLSTGDTSTGLSGALDEINDVWRQRVSLGRVEGADLGEFEEEAVPLSEGETRPKDDDDDIMDRAAVARRPDRVTDFLESLAQPSDTALHYLHVILPHRPWVLYPDGTRYVAAKEITGSTMATGPIEDWGLAQSEQQHLLQAQYTDRLLGEVFDTLKASGRYDDSLVVVMADHGVTFKTWPNNRQPTPETVDGIAYAPLFIKEPGQGAGRIDDENLMAPDVLPTIADILDVELPGPVDGLAATDPRVRKRGQKKEIYDFRTGFQAEFESIVDFDDTEQPVASTRWIGPIGPKDPVLGGLFSYLGVEKYLGADPRELDTVAGGTVEVNGLKQESAPSNGVVIGTAAGRIEDGSEGTLLIAVDGVISSAAPVAEDGTFNAMLPPPDTDGTRGELTMLYLLDGELRTLDAVPATS